MKRIYSKDITSRFYYMLLALIIALSALVRFIPLIKGDIPFLFDHGRDMLAVKQIVVGHKLTLIGPFTGLQGVFQSPLHFYLLAIPFILTGGNPAAGTWMMAILALIGIFLCYVLGKNMIDRVFGLIVALFFAFSPTSLAFTAHFWNPHWIPFCMILFYYFLFKSIFINNKFWPFVGLMAGLVAQFEVAFGIPLFLCLFVVVLLFNRRALRSIYFWSIIPVFLLTFFPQILFDIRHQFLMTKTILGFLHGANGGTGGTIDFPTRFFYRLNEIQHATIFTISDNIIVSYIVSSPIIIFLGLGIIRKMKSELRIFSLFLIIPLLFFILFLFYSHEAWSWYWIGLQISYYLLLAFSLSRLLQMSTAWKIFSLAMIAFWLVSIIVPKYIFLSQTYPGETGTLKNELRVVDTIYHDAQDHPFGEFVYTPPIYDYAYQYLFWWKGTTQYGYQPTKDKNGIFYLIMEPDPDHPYAIQGWKDTVIKTGRVVWDKVLPGNITIEKRVGR